MKYKVELISKVNQLQAILYKVPFDRNRIYQSRKRPYYTSIISDIHHIAFKFCFVILDVRCSMSQAMDDIKELILSGWVRSGTDYYRLM